MSNSVVSFFKKEKAQSQVVPPMQSVPPMQPVPPMQQMSNQEMWQNNQEMCTPPPSGSAGPAGLVRLIPNPKCKESDEVVAVIVTICGGSSYDNMFSTVPQEGPAEGTRIAVYQMSPDAMKYLDDRIKKMPIKEASEDTKETKETKDNDDVKPRRAGGDAFDQLCQDIQEVDADSVVFNWECCSGCSEKGFGHQKNNHAIPFMETLIQHGHMVMCSDFSLKALIAQWGSNTKLGPNPFVQLGTFGSSFTLHFDPKTLSECPSSQLQKVGDLMKENGSANVHAMSSTIVYSLDKAIADNSHYKYQVLTVASQCSGFDVKKVTDKYTHSANKQKGVCGHVLLEYPTGGRLLTSCGHWIELLKLDVNEKQLLEVAEREYGTAYVQDLQVNLAQCRSSSDRAEFVQKKAAYMVQSSCPMEMSKGYGRVKSKGGKSRSS
jgi:hypothetical protein